LFILLGLTRATAADIAANGDPSWLAASRIAQQSQESGDLASAERLWRDALRSAREELGENHKQIAALLSNLGGVLHLEGRDREAYPLARHALVVAEASGETELIASALNELGLVLSGAGEHARAEPVLRRSLALFEQLEGEDALHTAEVANNLAVIYCDTRQYSKAEALMRRALPLYEKYFGPEDRAFAAALSNMFTILSAQRKLDEGEPYLRRALAIGEKRFPGTAAIAHVEVCLAQLEFSRGNLQESARILRAAIELQERTLGREHPEVARSLACYAAVERRLRNRTEAKEAERRANLITKQFTLY